MIGCKTERCARLQAGQSNVSVRNRGSLGTAKLYSHDRGIPRRDSEDDAVRTPLDVSTLVAIRRGDFSSERERGSRGGLFDTGCQLRASVAQALTGSGFSRGKRYARVSCERDLESGPHLRRGRLVELDAGKFLRPLAQDRCCAEEDVATLDDRSLRAPRQGVGRKNQPGCSGVRLLSCTVSAGGILTRFHFFAAASAVARTFGTSSAVMDETVCRVDEGVWGSLTL